MDTIRNIMLHEHAIILNTLNSVENKLKQFEKDNILHEHFFQNLLNFLNEFIKKVHHVKEEEILFNLVKENNLHIEDEKIDQLLHQHKISNRLFKEIDNALHEKDKNLIIIKIKDYIKMIRDHIKAEDEEFFPVLENKLPEHLKVKAKEMFEQVDKQKEVKDFPFFEIDFSSVIQNKN